MSTVTNICNAAIGHCGTRSKISAIDEGSPEANACLTHFAMVRDATLRAYDWNFARITQGLADLGNPPTGWAFRYAVPVDCLRLRRLNDVPLRYWSRSFCQLSADRDATGAFINVILANAAPARAVYTARVSDPLRWDAGFVDAIAYGLAMRICFELTGKEERARTLAAMWQAALRQAGAEAAGEPGPLGRAWLPEALAARGYDESSTLEAIARLQ